MRINFTFFIVYFFTSIATFAQVESVGTCANTLPYSTNCWVNNSVTYSGTGDTRTSTPSSGYALASGGRNVFLTNNGNSNLIISNITYNPSATSGQLCFGVFKSTTASNGSELQISYNNATGPASISLPTGTGTAIWAYRCITINFTASPITITFTNTASGAGTPQFRLDDIGLSNSVLPVVLSNFNIAKSEVSTLLSFSTASETNNSHFDIERSGDGRNFLSIGKIQGAGDSREERHYSFIDEKPLPGMNYYRIKQTDFDGKYSYSEIKVVRFNSALSFDITPRQTEGRLMVATEIENYSLQVLGSDGRLILSLSNLSASQNIDLDGFKPGIYYIRFLHDGVSETKRIVRI